VNPQYQDKNYAGALIIWDRLFGTFEPEVEPVVYGITTPLNSWNPVWANVHVFADIVRNAARTRRWRDKWRVVFGHPGYLPDDLAAGGTAPKFAWPVHAPPFDPVVPRAHQLYALAQFTVILVAAYLTLLAAESLAAHEMAAMVFLVTVGLVNVGAVVEGRRTLFGMEFARLATIAAAASVFVARGERLSLAVPVLVFTVLSSVWLSTLRRAPAVR
jgi:alkylglycerol monooxygenase